VQGDVEPPVPGASRFNLHPWINQLIDVHLGRAARVHTSAKQPSAKDSRRLRPPRGARGKPCKLPRVTIKMKLMVKKNISQSCSVTPV
jgi:hypothetical protein